MEMIVFQNMLTMQMRAHPSMEPQDVVKLCYQAANGAEHLLEDLSDAQRYFMEEYEAVPTTEEPLFEPISRDVYRVNLGAWKAAGLPPMWLFRMFTGTVFQKAGRERLTAYLNAAEEVLRRADCPMENWELYLADYIARGMPPVRHSETYRAAEHPAYRIVHVDYVLLMPVLRRVFLAEQKPCVIAIDGMAGAGKSTYADKLQKVLQAGMVYMDDFFLPPVLRSTQRLAEPGGNVHYERFAEEVLPHIHRQQEFSYKVFACSVMDYGGTRTVIDSPYRIVEGSYSHHPTFGDYADVRVFMHIDPETQLQRITLRNGEEMAERFRQEWIPMENQYFEHFQIKEQAYVTACIR